MNISKYTLRNQWICREPGALGKAQFALGKDHSVKNESAKTSLPSVFCRALGKAFAECPTLGKVGTEKKPEKIGNFTQKKWLFFNWCRTPPVSAHPSLAFSRKFHGYAADRIRTRVLPLRTNLLYHYTTLSLVSGFRFSSQPIILNRV